MIRAAMALQILLLVYHQVTTLFDFYPFNGVRFYTAKEQWQECAVNGILMVLPIIGFGSRITHLMRFGAVYYFVLLAVELKIWWVPYLFGASEKWRRDHGRIHAGTVTVLPPIKSHPIPNLEHLILQALTVLTAIATLLAWLGP